MFHEHETPPGLGGGGAESILRDLTVGLRRRGHEVAWLQSPQIDRAVGTFRPDVVQVITIHNRFGMAPVRWLQAHGIPHVWALMDYWPFCGNRNLLRGGVGCSAVRGVCDTACPDSLMPAEWADLVNGSPVVALCEPSAAILRRNGVAVAYVAEPGLDTTLFMPGTKEPGSMYASSAWGMHPVKGLPVLQEAIRGARVDVRVITGLPREQVAEALSTAAIYVFPSCYEETFGLALCEAMAAGCACVASDVAGARAQIVDEVNGLLVPPRDAVALRAAIQRLIDDPALVQRLGEAARAHVEKGHTLEAMARRWEDVYDTVMAASAVA